MSEQILDISYLDSLPPEWQIDLLPTLLELLNLETPDALPGVDLLSANVEDRSIFFERDRPSTFRQRGILLGDRKLISVEQVGPEKQRTKEGKKIPKRFDPPDVVGQVPFAHPIGRQAQPALPAVYCSRPQAPRRR